MFEFLRHAGDVRRQHEVRAVGEDGAAASVEGLFIEDVEGGAPEAVLLQRRRQRSLVDDAAAGRVDEDRIGAHARDRLGADEAARFGRQRHVQRDDVGRDEEIVKRDPRDRIPGGIVRRHEGIVRDDAHAEGRGARGRLPRDGAEADEAEPLAGDLAAHQAAARPGAGDHLRRRRVGAAQQKHRRADDVFRHRDVVGAARRTDGDAACPARLDVDVVEPDPEPADDLQRSGGFEQRAAHLRAVADDEAARPASAFARSPGRSTRVAS